MTMDRPARTRLDPVFFANPSEFHAWLEKNHDKAPEVWVGFHKKSSGIPSITWAESVDEALCFGWIVFEGALMILAMRIGSQGERSSALGVR
jgi:uncharacterized protein YdeI (YjbR/CyaY-like superfamily)